MIRNALVLAAGRGRAVAHPEMPNCLASVGGVPLLLRTLRVLRAVGVRTVAITVGWQAAEVRRAVAGLRAAEPSLPEMVFFDNLAWERPNGLSVLAARSFLTERTLLLMADQIAAPHLVAEIARQPAAADETVLAGSYTEGGPGTVPPPANTSPGTPAVIESRLEARWAARRCADRGVAEGRGGRAQVTETYA